MEEIIESKNTKRPNTIIVIITILIIGYILTRDETSSFDIVEQLSLGDRFLQELLGKPT